MSDDGPEMAKDGKFPLRYTYPAMRKAPHHRLSLENGRLFFVGCYYTEEEAILRMDGRGDQQPMILNGWIQGEARYDHGNLVQVLGAGDPR